MKFSLLVLLTLSSFNALAQAEVGPEGEPNYANQGQPGNIIYDGPEGEYSRPSRVPENKLADCSMSTDERTISCPNGIYKKMQSTVESSRNLVPERPAAGSRRLPSPTPKSSRPE